MAIALRMHGCLQVTKGYAAAETINAAGRSAALAERSGNLAQLTTSITLSATAIVLSGDVAAGSRLADRAGELAIRRQSQKSRGRPTGRTSNTGL